jgi:hypothetical protein
MVRVPTSVQRQRPAPVMNSIPILKRECFIRAIWPQEFRNATIRSASKWLAARNESSSGYCSINRPDAIRFSFATGRLYT